MILLGIETSTAVCSVGLSSANNGDAKHKDGKELRAVKSIVESHIHSEKLLTMINDLCETSKINLRELSAIAVSIGPGSFTGLRIGLSTAKGLCYSLAKPIIAVPTFKAIAAGVFYSYPACSRIIIYIDAKQGEYYNSIYEISDTGLKEIKSVAVGSLAKSMTCDFDNTIIVTDRPENLKTVYPDPINIVDVLTVCRGDIVADLAIEMFKSGQLESVENLEPVYLKDFVIRSHDNQDFGSIRR